MIVNASILYNGKRIRENQRQTDRQTDRRTKGGEEDKLTGESNFLLQTVVTGKKGNGFSTPFEELDIKINRWNNL